MDAHLRRCKLTQQLRQARTRDAAIDQHRLTGIAHAHTLGLRIQHDRIRLGKIGGFVDVDMAISRARFDDRNERMLHAVPNKSCPTARNEHVDQIAQQEELVGDAAIGRIDDHHAVLRQPRLRKRPLQHFAECNR